MLIGLSTPVFDLEGAIQLNAEPDSDVQEYTRRVSRTPTLDGGAWINDGGYSAADRIVTVTVRRPTPAEQDFVRRLVQNYSILHISLPDGTYPCVIDNLNIAPSSLTFQALLTGTLLNG